ncbi:hypothetical protein ACFTZJ_22220 [Streptomyces globisporus]|uniref:hypothetical protein n=1 Tax=Streptomyces globisporus TaxID=1908 RepID=UPI00363845F0
MTVRDVDELQDKGVQGWWQPERRFVDAQCDTVLVVQDVVGGQAAGSGGSLAVEQDHQAGDTVLGLEGVVIEELAGDLPSFVGIERAVGDPMGPGGDADPEGELAADGPGDERTGGVRALGGFRGEPEVDVFLSAGRQLSPGFLSQAKNSTALEICTCVMSAVDAVIVFPRARRRMRATRSQRA